MSSTLTLINKRTYLVFKLIFLKVLIVHTHLICQCQIYFKNLCDIMKIFSTDTSTYYNTSTITSFLTTDGLKKYFSKVNTCNDCSRSRSASAAREEALHKIELENCQKEDIIPDMLQQETKKKGLSLPWSSYVAFLGLSSTNSNQTEKNAPPSKPSKTSIKSNNSRTSKKSKQEEEKLQVKLSIKDTKTKKKKGSSKLTKQSFTSMDSATDVLKSKMLHKPATKIKSGHSRFTEKTWSVQQILPYKEPLDTTNVAASEALTLQKGSSEESVTKKSNYRPVKKHKHTSKTSVSKASSKVLRKSTDRFRRHRTAIKGKLSGTSVKVFNATAEDESCSIDNLHGKGSKKTTTVSNLHKQKFTKCKCRQDPDFSIIENSLRQPLPQPQIATKKRCKGECVGKGRVVFSEKDINGEETMVSLDDFSRKEHRKHMSIFDLDKYLFADEHGSTEMLKTKISKGCTTKKPFDSTIFPNNAADSTSEDSATRQKISKHEISKKRKSKKKTEDAADEALVNVVNYDSNEARYSSVRQMSKTESDDIDGMITELVIKVNLIKDLLPNELRSKDNQPNDIDNIISTIHMLKKALRHRNSCKHNELLDTISKVDFYNIHNTRSKLEKFLKISDGIITQAIPERELVSIVDKQECINSNCSLVQTKNNESQTEPKLLKNASIQHISEVSETDLHKNLSQSSTYIKVLRKCRATWLSKYKEESKSTKNSGHKRKDVYAVDTESRGKHHKKHRKPSNDKVAPIWGSTYQIQDCFKCESIEKLQSEKELTSFDKCCSTHSNNFVLRLVTKSDLQEEYNEPIVYVIKEKASNQKLSMSSIADYETDCDTEMTEDSLINYCTKFNSTDSDYNYNKKCVDKCGTTVINESFLDKPKSNISLEVQGYCSITTIELAEMNPVYSDIRSKESCNPVQNVNEKIEAILEIETQKISANNDLQIQETGKHEERVLNCDTSKVSEKHQTRSNGKFSLTKIYTDDNLKFSVLIHTYDDKESMTDIENCLNQTTIATGVNINDLNFTTAPEVNLDEDSISRFPTITIYNKNYVNSIGDWIKNYLTESSSNEKLRKSLISLEHQLKKNDSWSKLNDSCEKINCLGPERPNLFTIRRTCSELVKVNVNLPKQIKRNNTLIKNNKKVLECYLCQQHINNLNFFDATKKNKPNRKSRIPVYKQERSMKIRQILNDLGTIGLERNSSSVMTIQHLFNSTKMALSQRSDDETVCYQSDEFLNSLDAESVKETENITRPKYHLISRTYCTLDDCINIGEKRITTKSTTSFLKSSSKSVQFNSSAAIPLINNKSGSNNSCKDRIHSLMSALHNKKREKYRKGIWKNFKLSLKKKEAPIPDWENSKKIDASNRVEFTQGNRIKYYHQNDFSTAKDYQRNDVELLQGCKKMASNKSLQASSYQTIFSKDTEIVDGICGIELVYSTNKVVESETFTICAPNSRFGMHSRARSVESFFKPRVDMWRSKSACFNCNQCKEKCCGPTKKTCSSNLLVKNHKLQEYYHYCKCGQLLKIEIVKNVNCND